MSTLDLGPVVRSDGSPTDATLAIVAGHDGVDCPHCREATEPHGFVLGDSGECAYELPSGFLCGDDEGSTAHQ